MTLRSHRLGQTSLMLCVTFRYFSLKPEESTRGTPKKREERQLYKKKVHSRFKVSTSLYIL